MPKNWDPTKPLSAELLHRMKPGNNTSKSEVEDARKKLEKATNECGKSLHGASFSGKTTEALAAKAQKLADELKKLEEQHATTKALTEKAKQKVLDDRAAARREAAAARRFWKSVQKDAAVAAAKKDAADAAAKKDAADAK